MSSDPLTPLPVPNRYRVALSMAKHASRSDTTVFHDLFRAAIRAFEAGAWQGGLADDRYIELSRLRLGAQSAAERCDSEFDDEIERQPLEVPAGSWQARWIPDWGMPWPW